MNRLSRSLRLYCLLAIVGAAPASSGAEPKYDRIPWRTPRVTFAAQQRSVRDLLKEFGALQNLPLTVGELVKGVVSGGFTDIPTQGFLDIICESNDLVWFFDGVRIYVETADEVISRPLSLMSITQENLNEVLFSIGYVSGPPGREVAVRAGHRAGILLLVGGPQFVAATEALARDLDEQENRRASEQITVRTFRLNYANADNIRINSGGMSRELPGVAMSLQNLLANQLPGSALTTGVGETELPRSRPGLRGAGLAAVGGSPDRLPGPNPLIPGLPAPASPSEPSQMERADPQDPRAPMIVADTRLNAVLVRDVASRMPLYEELIKMLDVPTKAIEISAAIVDIDSGFDRNLGLEILGLREGTNVFGQNADSEKWQLGFDADRGVFDGNNTQGQIPSFVDGLNLARGAGLNATALIGGSGFEILGRLRALEKVGAGQIVSRPSILTMENMQAVIRTDETVYVRVEGNMEVDLFDVSTGVQLRVTPAIIREGDSETFRLQIDITDGSFVDRTVDDIPITRESAINTQAMVPENKTLLLGGYFVERRARNSDRIPVLGSIPLVGKVFSRNQRTHDRSQRFFFITPRIVDVRAESTFATDYSKPDENDLSIARGIPKKQMSPQEVRDLARRLAGEAINVPPPIEYVDPAILEPLPQDEEPTPVPEKKKRKPYSSVFRK